MRNAALKAPSRATLLMIIPLVLGVLVGSYFVVPPFREAVDRGLELLASGDQKALQAWVAGLGVLGPLTIIGLMIAQTLLSAVPMALIMFVSVLDYGPLWGGILGSAGALLAAIVGYGIARLLGPATIDRFLSPEVRKKVEEPVRRYGPWSIIALRVSMLVPTDSISFVAGLVKMPFVPFVLATIVGIIPVAVVVAYFGADLSRLGPGLLVVTAVSLTALASFVIYDWTRRRKAKAGGQVPEAARQAGGQGEDEAA